MKVSGQFYISAEVDEVINISPNPIPFDENNNQKTPLVISLRDGSGAASIARKAFVKVVVQLGTSSTTPTILGSHILNEKNASGNYVAQSDFSFTMPNSSDYETYGKATQFEIRVYDTNTEIAASFPSESALTESVIVGINRDKPDYNPLDTDWSTAEVYKNGDYFIYNKMIYMWIYPMQGNTDINPQQYCTDNPNNAYWKAYEKKDILATGFLLADGGRLGDFVFQKTTDGGVFKSVNDDEEGNPNLWMNSKTGKFKCNNAEVKGTIDADSGVFKNVKSPNESFQINEEGDVTLNNATMTNANISGKVSAGSGNIGNLNINENGALVGGSQEFTNISQFTPYVPSTIINQEEQLKAVIKDFVIDNYQRSSVIIFSTQFTFSNNSNTYDVNLPTRSKLRTDKVLDYGFPLKLIVIMPRYWDAAGTAYSPSPNMKFNIKSNSKILDPEPIIGNQNKYVANGELCGNNGEYVNQITLSDGDVLELYHIDGRFIITNWRN